MMLSRGRHRSRLVLCLAAALGACGKDDAAAKVDAGGVAADGSAPSPGGDGSSPSPQEDAAALGCGACAEYGSAEAVGTLPNTLAETSGLAASRRNAGILFAHNDSGDTARIFAVTDKGAALGEITISGATAIDWEDIAVGPCVGGGGSCVWIADVGDNAEGRTDYALYAIPEPVLDGQPFATKTIAARRFPFTYPDGKWNCETLLVHPTTGEIFLVTKKSSIEAGVYRFPTNLAPDVSATLEKLGSAKGTMGSLVTGGDLSPCGDRVLLRTYGSLLEYALAPGATVASALAAAPKTVPVALELQGEAIAFRADGRGYFTAPEGISVNLSFVGCK